MKITAEIQRKNLNIIDLPNSDFVKIEIETTNKNLDNIKIEFDSDYSVEDFIADYAELC